MEATFKQLIDMCESVGWDKGIAFLECTVRGNEWAQSELFAGDYNDIKKAQRMSKIIIKQNLSIARLKQYRAELLKPKQ